MARRYRFGGVADYVVALGDENVATLAPNVQVTFHTSDTGSGVQITDLTLMDGSTPIPGGIVTTDATGAMPEFMGPPDVTDMYVDANGGSGPRRRTIATDMGVDVVQMLAEIYGAGGLRERMTTAEENIDSGGGGGGSSVPGMVVPNGFTDSAVQAAMAEVLASNTGGSVGQLRKWLYLKPGVYNLTQPLVVSDAGTLNMIEGLRIEGAGIGQTVINWSGGSTPFITAADPRFRFPRISGFTINSQDAASVFAYLFSQQGGVYNQGWDFSQLHFTGAWTRGIGLDGGTNGNLNSEFVMERIYTSPSSSWSDAFFVSGMTNHATENQFLDFWIRDTCLSLNSGTMFKIRRGGAITLENGSWSAASTSSGVITWFDWTNAQSNNPDRNQMLVFRVRFEPKAATHKILNSNAADGMITFLSCSDQGASQNSGTYVHERYTINAQAIWGGAVAPTVRFTDCSLGGIVRYTGTTQTRGGFIFDGCKLYRGDTGQRAYGPQSESGAAIGATATNPVLQWASGQPKYDFVHGWNYNDAKSWATIA